MWAPAVNSRMRVLGHRHRGGRGPGVPWGSGWEVSIGMQVGNCYKIPPFWGVLGPTRAEEGPTLDVEQVRGRVPSHLHRQVRVWPRRHRAPRNFTPGVGVLRHGPLGTGKGGVFLGRDPLFRGSWCPETEVPWVIPGIRKSPFCA